MRVNVLFALSTCVLISGRLSEDNSILDTVKDFGSYHTKAFEELSKLYTDKRPTGKTGMYTDLVNIVASWCEGDSDCQDKTRTNMGSTFELVEKGGQDAEIPDDFDEDILDSISSMYSVLNTVTSEENIDEIIRTLEDIEKEVQDNKDASENEKLLAFGTLSIAKESALLWHRVYSDKSHALHGMHLKGYYEDESEERRLNHYEYDGDYHYHGDAHYHGYFTFPFPGGGDGDGDGDSPGIFSLPDFNITYTITEDVTTFFNLYAVAIADDPTSIIPLTANFLTTFANVLGPTIAASAAVGAAADDFE